MLGTIKIYICILAISTAYGSEDTEFYSHGESDSVGQDESDGGYEYGYGYDYNSDEKEVHDGCTGLIATHNICDINKFPEENLTSMIDFKNVHKESFCCNDHTYVAIDECEERSGSFDKEVCASAMISPNLSLYISRECPSNCWREKNAIYQKDFTIDATGNVVLNNTKVFSEQFCLKYQCDVGGDWVISADLCACHRVEVLENMINEADPSNKFSRCCPLSHVIHDKVENDRTTSSVCSKTSEHLDSCNGEPPNYVKFNKFNNPVNGTARSDIPIPSSYTSTCIGFKADTFSLTNREPTPMIRYCKPPCFGNVPCINICTHGKDTDIAMLTNGSDYTNLSKDVQDQLFNNFDLPLPADKKIFADVEFKHLDENMNFRQFSPRCGFGYKDVTKSPSKSCPDIFSITVDEDNTTMIHIRQDDISSKEYCLQVNEDLTYGAHFCELEEIQPLYQKRGIFTCLIISVVALLAIILVYSTVPGLWNAHNKVLILYVSTFLSSFLLIIVRKLTLQSVLEHTFWCKVIGYSTYLCTISTFCFMSVMAVNLTSTMRGGDNRYYNKIVATGFAIPAFLTGILILVGETHTQCQSYSPNFGNGRCWFGDRTARAIWIFIPLALSLVINVMCSTFVVGEIYRNYKRMKETKVTTNKKKNEWVDKSKVFLRLFVTMGFIWTIELITGLMTQNAAAFAFELIVALQGVWVMIATVTSDKVLKGIKKLRRKKGRSDNSNDTNSKTTQNTRLKTTQQ